MKKLLIAFSFASLLALPALAQSYGDRSGSDTSTTSQPPTGQVNNPAQQGTEDQKDRPNAACPPGSTNPECEQAQVPEENQPNNDSNEKPAGSSGESEGGSSR